MKAKQTGFTLIELMFTIVVLAVLLGIGVPNFRDFIRNSRMTAAANDLLADVNLARSEAVKRSMPVSLCSGSAGACDGGSFQGGWLVFVDRNGSGYLDGTETADDVLTQHEALPDSIQSVSAFATTDAEDAALPGYEAAAVDYFSFGASGFRRLGDGNMPTAVALVICDERGNTARGGPDMSAARAVEISATGRTVVSRSVERIKALGGCSP